MTKRPITKTIIFLFLLDINYLLRVIHSLLFTSIRTDYLFSRMFKTVLFTPYPSETGRTSRRSLETLRCLEKTPDLRTRCLRRTWGTRSPVVFPLGLTQSPSDLGGSRLECSSRCYHVSGPVLTSRTFTLKNKKYDFSFFFFVY